LDGSAGDGQGIAAQRGAAAPGFHLFDLVEWGVEPGAAGDEAARGEVVFGDGGDDRTERNAIEHERGRDRAGRFDGCVGTAAERARRSLRIVRLWNLAAQIGEAQFAVAINEFR